MALIDTLESAWYGSGSAPWWTWPLAALYGSTMRLRRGLYRRGWLRSTRLPVPVVVVGNISVGGTGKTPLTIALVEVLRARGYRPGVVSRGHGGSQREPLLLGEAPDPAQVGDEPCLIRASGAAVAVGRDRPAAARLLLDAGCNVVVADDGLQHYALARDIEICVIDGVRRFGNGRLLPAGPLREPLGRLQRVDFRVCNGVVAAEGEYPMQLRGGEVVALIDDQRWALAGFDGQRVHAVAAIGHPQRFFDSLRAAGIDVIEHAFADHHQFVQADLDFADDLPILMTDKDAVKCQRFAQPHWWRVPVRAELPAAFHEALVARVEALQRNRFTT
ncbi:tetraacyldisaccharide 4'-kinase [Rhodanobacter koreensis]